MFVDELTIHAKAGNGGNGVERWLREAHRPKGGPAGGNGGRGGDVYVRAVKDLAFLAKYSGEKTFAAQNGEHGKSRSKHGRDGEDLYIDVPAGSRVTNMKTGKTYELLEVGDFAKVLIGGQGGLGNEHFKSSTNRSPIETTKGKKGEVADLLIELSLVVDVGLIGSPNAGKSTLLNELTNARSAVGDYPFTTLEPHLGDCYGYIIADIPGLIAGASKGKGLGHKFLKHITRTKMLLHLVSLEHEDPFKAYETIRDELETFDPTLTQKPEWIVLTKSDVCDTEVSREAAKRFAQLGKTVFVVTAYDDESIKTLQKALLLELKNQRSL